jgi:hypothetical protein
MAEIMFDGKPLRLTEWTSCGGCAAKWGKDLLAGLVNDQEASNSLMVLDACNSFFNFRHLII